MAVVCSRHYSALHVVLVRHRGEFLSASFYRPSAAGRVIVDRTYSSAVIKRREILSNGIDIKYIIILSKRIDRPCQNASKYRRVCNIKILGGDNTVSRFENSLLRARMRRHKGNFFVSKPVIFWKYAFIFYYQCIFFCHLRVNKISVSILPSGRSFQILSHFTTHLYRIPATGTTTYLPISFDLLCCVTQHSS